MCVWEWNVLVVLPLFFSPCGTLSHEPTEVQNSLLLFPSRSFSCPVTPPFSAQVQTSFLQNDTKVSLCFLSFFLFCPWHRNRAQVHADKLLPLSKSVLRLNHTIPVASSELRIKSCIPRPRNSGFAPKSLLGHSEKRNGLKDQKHTQKWADARCSPGSVFFKCCCVLSKEGEKKDKRFMESEGPSSCGCSMCHRVEIKNQRINRVCCVTKLKAFYPYMCVLTEKHTALMKHNLMFPVISIVCCQGVLAMGLFGLL